MEFHILCQPNDIAPYIFLPPDPAGAATIAGYFEDSRLVNESRGYYIYTGVVDGVRMSVCSSGVGGPQLAIGLEELAHLGAHTFLRVGRCGALQETVRAGDVVIPTGVFRGGATADRYLPEAFPAAPHWDLLSALVTAGRSRGKPHVGRTYSGDAFYAELDEGLRSRLQQAGVLAMDMETDTLFVMANYRNWRAGSVLTCYGPAAARQAPVEDEHYAQGEATAIALALEAMKQIAGQDHAGSHTATIQPAGVA